MLSKSFTHFICPVCACLFVFFRCSHCFMNRVGCEECVLLLTEFQFCLVVVHSSIQYIDDRIMPLEWNIVTKRTKSHRNCKLIHRSIKKSHFISIIRLFISILADEYFIMFGCGVIHALFTA